VCYSHLELWRLGHYHRWGLGQQEERNASNSGTFIIHSNTMIIFFIQFKYIHHSFKYYDNIFHSFYSYMLVSLIQFRFICHSLRYAVSFFNNLDLLISHIFHPIFYIHLLFWYLSSNWGYFIIHHFFVLIPVKQLSKWPPYFFIFFYSFNIF
jgi:hypothetical protein